MKETTDFPILECVDLHDKSITLPKDIKGKKSILVLAASQKSEEDLRSWMLPLYNDFIADQSENMFAMESYDINTYFIPVFSGVAKAAANNIKKKLLKGLDPALQSHVLIYKGSANKLFDELDLDKKTAALVVLDEQGNIIKKFTGAYSEDKMDKIKETIGSE